MTLLKIDDAVKLKKGQKVYAYIPRKYAYNNGDDCLIPTKIDLRIGDNINGYDTSYLAGYYRVIYTMIEGGGNGHGVNDVFPDGHHVFLIKICGDDAVIDFYQTGCFTAMIKENEIDIVNNMSFLDMIRDSGD